MQQRTQMKPDMDIAKIRLLRDKLRQVEREINDPFRTDGGCCGLSLGQCHTLLEVGNAGQVSLVDLASNLNLDTSTLSRTIQGLVMLGLVNRLTSDRDRRYVSISLTEQGRGVYDKIESTFNDYFARVIELIPADQRDAAIDGVTAFADALKAHNHSASCCADGEGTADEEKK
jgi:DNA-binding MarR family transcriptional regulator